jgi:hypothetical protein
MKFFYDIPMVMTRKKMKFVYEKWVLPTRKNFVWFKKTRRRNGFIKLDGS